MWKVKFWDETEKQAKTREEAVQIAEAGLEGWRQGDDKVVWTTPGRLPVQATVITEYCEETDACAIIYEIHEGEIWRKPGPFGWCKIVRNITPEAPNYDGGLSGFSVQYGNFSRKTKRIHWRALRLFAAAENYADFVKQMKGEHYHLMEGNVKDQTLGMSDNVD